LSIHARRPTLPRRLARDDAAVGPARASGGTRTRLLVGVLLGAGVVVAAAAAIAFELSGVTVRADGIALARVHLGALAGTLSDVTVRDAHGAIVPTTVHDGAIVPRRHVAPGAALTVVARVRRPGFSGWALGATVSKRLIVRTPSAALRTRWTTLHEGAPLRVAFAAPVARIAYGTPGALRHVVLRHPQQVVTLGPRAAAGSLVLAGAPRTWERLPAPSTVTWFPAGGATVAVASPPPGGRLGPLTPVRVAFSKPLSALRGARPAFAGPVAGSWRRADSHTLLFTPSGTGFGLGASVRLTLPAGVTLAGAAGGSAAAASWTVPPGSTLRLHELLAQLGYLPLSWTPAAGAQAVAAGDGPQLTAAVDPPKGSFAWRWPLPGQLTSQWSPASASAITRGALMAFERDRGLTTDGLPGPAVWSALFAALRAHQVNKEGYSYVLVHRDSATQTATLFHDGKTIVSTPANTGVPAAPTQLGTFPVYLRYDVTTMSGTNPDGTRYRDPGIRWVSYFNGGDALHAFDRASFGTPQSVGCVELPEAAAAKIYPYTPIGTLVQIAP